MHLLLLAGLLASVPDTLRTSLPLAPPIMRFTQSSDLGALLSGDGRAGFGSNPAVLGGSGPPGFSSSTRYASRMPKLNLPDFHDFSQSFAFASHGNPRLGFGLGAGFRSMSLGSGKSAREYSLGIGRRMDASGLATQDLGASLKAVLMDGFDAKNGMAPTAGYLADLGYLITVGGFLRAGAALENLGKGVTGVHPVLIHISDEGSQSVSLSYGEGPESRLTPLTLSLGAALIRSVDVRDIRVIDASLAGTWAKMPGRGPDGQSFATVVLEGSLFRTLGCRWGILRDPSSAEVQGKFGISLFLFNHFRLAFVSVASTGGREHYDGQKGFVLECTNLLGWDRGDKAWWKSPRREPAP
jgi:hypothetical protein